ncbi:MAG: hypothetical protein COU31_00385 [Candidatus Magasanikbacteria bacterium CG10_big_fil_rev_8_21_14_0_10_40_10]|uniref:Penicillin-binding protein 2 n=1 Tax=Candidatus Magasanikbacteria bacterium CG10_big_fil_rev_8_21_14_0_10_40_10 TaxID=1974648 RepID=A0A2M6W565_9BACT|nr:MAG: hypothetical protein COU31_00385 [Candidatus Magasanikbacteria bacterium CG10_big_fil_rev_8_21_14_0_10_40_10]
MIIKARKIQNDQRFTSLAVILYILAFIVVGRLLILQIFNFDYYTALAINTHEIYQQLFPKRGNIYIQDSRSGKDQLYPVSVERPFYLLYAVPRDIAPNSVATTTDFLAGLLKFDDEQKKILSAQLSKKNDPYEPIVDKLTQETAEIIKQAGLAGINLATKNYRYYSENKLVSNVVGFVGSDTDGNLSGRYGIEGGWDSELAGKSGFLAVNKGALGSIISLAGKTEQTSENGADLVLTIDRSLQDISCESLRQGVATYQAQSASLIMLDAQTGAILAMCSYPDFDPNNYAKVSSASAYNNTAIFTAYEPGSVFKPITMAMALDLNAVGPDTLFNDPGVRVIDNYKVYNALKKQYGTITMTQVLENSVNTGMIWVEEKIGNNAFEDYVKKFGFGQKLGIKMDGEVDGNISSLEKKSDIYFANASFGQGITATPLQLVASYTALANGGQMLKPYIIKEVRYANGKVEKTIPQTIGNVISQRAQKLITGMLISVVENGAGYVSVKMPEYYVAGKTGTAQIAGPGGYTEETNHTFIGYFPATDPRFIMLVKYEKPQRAWAESTAAPTFKKVADFAVDYYNLKGDK